MNHIVSSAWTRFVILFICEIPHVLNSNGEYSMTCNGCLYERQPRKGKYMRPVRPWDLLKKENYTQEELRNARLAICNSCAELNGIRQCKQCHCFVDAKTWLENAYCPLRKW